MTGASAGRRVHRFPLMRNLVIDACRYGKRKNMVHGLIEVDVTEARRRIHEREERTGRDLSFTAFVVHALASAVAEDPSIQAYRGWGRRLVIFEDVDVNTILEREVHGTMMGTVHIVREANRRSVEEIHADIRAAQERKVEARQHPAWYLSLYLPGFVRGLLWRTLGRFPDFVKRNAGTVSVSAFGMHAEGGGWGIGLGAHTLGLAIGGIAPKPVAVDGRVEIRELLSLTVSFDHDIVDGAPAARFARRLKERIERADGLDEAAA